MESNAKNLRTVKVYLPNDEVRRFKFDAAPGPYTWPAFQAKAFEVFDGENLVFTYKDVDGDFVTVSNTDDFEQLLAEQAAGPLRLFARDATESDGKSEQKLKPESEQSEHQPVQNEPNELESKPDNILKPETCVSSAVQAAEAKREAAEKAASAAAIAAAEAQRTADAAARVAAQEEEARVAAARAVADAELARIQAEAEAAEIARLAAIEAEHRKPVIHPGVTCAASGQTPLSGTRYHKIGLNIDLCEIEFAKLPEPEKQLYEIILRPDAIPIQYEPVIHYGVQCDGTGSGPIIGLRCHEIGKDYDLSQPEFAKLDEEKKRCFELIATPRSVPVPYYVPPEPKVTAAPPEHCATKKANTRNGRKCKQQVSGHCHVDLESDCASRQCCPGIFIFGMILFTALFGPRALITSILGLASMKAFELKPREYRKTATLIVLASIIKCCCLFPLIFVILVIQANDRCSRAVFIESRQGVLSPRYSCGSFGRTGDSNFRRNSMWHTRERPSRRDKVKFENVGQVNANYSHAKQD